LFGDVNSWLIWQLSGSAVHVTDPSMAARTMLFSTRQNDWDTRLLDLFGVPASVLPSVADTACRLAETDPAVCGGRVTITAAAGDQQASLFGHRCWRQGEAKLTLGTGGFLWSNAGLTPPEVVPLGVVASTAWRIGGTTTCALEGFVPNAGGVTPWLRRLGAIAPDEWPVLRSSTLAGVPGPLWCIPAIYGLGTPNWDSVARADIIGLTADSTGKDLAGAALLGVAHQVVDALEAVLGGTPPAEAGPIRLDGGLADNDSVAQAIADLSGRLLERPARREMTSLGVAALAAIGSELLDLPAVAAFPFPIDRRFSPSLSPAGREAHRAAWREVLDSARRRWSGGEP
jgi:glycerol kinase